MAQIQIQTNLIHLLSIKEPRRWLGKIASHSKIAYLFRSPTIRLCVCVSECTCLCLDVSWCNFQSSFAFHIIKSIKCIQLQVAGSCKYAVNIKLIALLSGRTCAARILNVSFFFILCWWWKVVKMCIVTSTRQMMIEVDADLNRARVVQVEKFLS